MARKAMLTCPTCGVHLEEPDALAGHLQLIAQRRARFGAGWEMSPRMYYTPIIDAVSASQHDPEEETE